RDPLPFQTTGNFSADHRTRVMLFAINVDLIPPEDSSAVTATASFGGQNYPMPVEFVGKIPDSSWLTEIVLKLPEQLSTGGDVLISISLHGTKSNDVLITIR